jgi:hypothetical protein
VSDELPEGIDRDTVLAHALSMQIVVDTINKAAEYLGLDDGAEGEARAEQELSDAIELLVLMPADTVGNVILAFASLVIQVTEPEAVQAWLDMQREKIAEVLG